MSFLLVVVLGTSAIAFFGCVLLGLCRDAQPGNEVKVVEVVRLLEQTGTGESATGTPRNLANPLPLPYSPVRRSPLKWR